MVGLDHEYQPETPKAPKELPLAERIVWKQGFEAAVPQDLMRLAWAAGYKAALEDLDRIEDHGGEITINGELIYKS